MHLGVTALTRSGEGERRTCLLLSPLSSALVGFCRLFKVAFQLLSTVYGLVHVEVTNKLAVVVAVVAVVAAVVVAAVVVAAVLSAAAATAAAACYFCCFTRSC